MCMSLCKFHSTFCNFLQIQTLVFQHWSERRIKAELSSALPNPCLSNASYSQGETTKDSFLPLSLSHWYHLLCRPNPVKLTPCAIKKTQKYLKLNSPNWTTFGWQPHSRDLSYPKILTGAPNREDREDKTYKLNKKNHIHRVVNSTLTYALSHGGYRIKYRVAWHGWLLSWPAWGRTDTMISSCRCYGVPDLLRVPSPSSCGWVLNR